MLHCKEANESEKREAFFQVHSIWPHARDASEHLERRLASLQQQRASWFVGLVDGKVVTSLGAYPYALFGPEGHRSARFFAAVFTQEAARGHGHAEHLMRWTIAHYREQGIQDFLLFSDIGHHYYEKLGFAALPSYEWTIEVPMTPLEIPFTWRAAPLEPTRPGHLGCLYGIERSPEDDLWIQAKQMQPLQLSRFSHPDGSDSGSWLLSRREGDSYILLESNVSQMGDDWALFRELVKKDAQQQGCRLAQGWWTASAATPDAEQSEIIARDKEILMWMSVRGAIDAWHQPIVKTGFRVFASEHV